MFRQRLVRALAAMAAAGVLAAGCGDDGGSASGGGGEQSGPQTLKIGLIPIADVAPVFLGIKKGFFEEEQLKLDPQFAAGGAAITPAVVSGDFDIGFSNTVSLLIAGSKDLPVQIVSQGVLGGPNLEKPWADLLVPKDGDIKDPKDLEGKTIAANTLNNICEVTINATLEEMGVDVSKLKYTEIPFPEMVAALEKGRVDAACVVEPFVTQGKGAGMRGIDPFYANTAPNLTVATYFASRQYIEENPEVVDRFVSAMEKSLQYASEHPDEVRDVLTEYTEIPPEAAGLPGTDPDDDPAPRPGRADPRVFRLPARRSSARPVRGMWVPERVWEQHLTSALAEAGIEYTTLDDFHFERAGLAEDDLLGYYLTEDDGRLLKVFPASERMRYLIPFQEPHASYEYLRRLAEERPGSTVVFADDGEKFGTWPKTHEHVYTNGWLRRFCDMIRGEPRLDRADPVRPGGRHDAAGGEDLPPRRVVPRDDGVGPARLATGRPRPGRRPPRRAGPRRGLLAQLQGEVRRDRRDVRPDARGLESPGRPRGQPRGRPRLPRRRAARAVPGPVQLPLLARRLRRALSAPPPQRRSTAT